eukprot:gene26572-33173_t
MLHIKSLSVPTLEYVIVTVETVNVLVDLQGVHAKEVSEICLFASTCPNDCSGHGICSTIKDVALFSGPDYDSTVEFSGDGLGAVYTNWDKNSIQLCECDLGFFGADCTLLMCPKGDDPMTINQNYRQVFINVQTGSSHELSGKMGLAFMGQTVFIDLTYPSSSACTSAISFHGAFGHVTCSISILNGFQYSMTLAFYSWPVMPRENNMYSHNGNPSRYDFYCDMSSASPLAFCEFTDIQASNIREYTYCSNRGNCDFSSGLCACQDGYGGPACSNATYLYTEGSSSQPGLAVNSNNLDFTGQVVRIASQKSKAPDFYLIQALAGGEEVFSVMGDGTVNINRLKTLTGGQTVSGSGLFVEAGGITITGDGLNVYTSTGAEPVATINSKYAASLASTYTVLKVSSLGTNPNTHYLAQFWNQGKSKVDIRADGAIFMRGAGLTVSSGVTVTSGGMKVTAGGLTVTAGGLRVNAAGLLVTGGATVYNNGLNVMGGGMQVQAGGVTVFGGGMKVYAGFSIQSGGLIATGGTSVANSGLTVTGGMTVFTGGLKVTSGLTILSGGMVITSNGLTITDGGVTVTTKGLTVVNGGLFVTTSGLTVKYGGLTVTSGLTVFQGGLLVTTGGLTVANTGIIVTGGLTINSLGLSVTGGATLNNAGLWVSGGISVYGALLSANAGIGVTGGLTVHLNGLVVTGGLTVNSGNTVLTNDFLTYGKGDIRQGLIVSGGMTVWGSLNSESSYVVFSDRRLKTNMAPIRNALDKVSKLQGVYFNWIQDEPTGLSFDKNRHVGIIAQDVLAVLPEVVEQKHQGLYLGVDYASMIPLLIEAIHDLEELLTKRVESPPVPQKVVEKPASQNVEQSDEIQSLRKDVTSLQEANRSLMADMAALRREMLEFKSSFSSAGVGSKAPPPVTSSDLQREEEQRAKEQLRRQPPSKK